MLKKLLARLCCHCSLNARIFKFVKIAYHPPKEILVVSPRDQKKFSWSHQETIRNSCGLTASIFNFGKIAYPIPKEILLVSWSHHKHF